MEVAISLDLGARLTAAEASVADGERGRLGNLIIIIAKLFFFINFINSPVESMILYSRFPRHCTTMNYLRVIITSA